jgi:long-chain acyl-CoA synthetase
MIYVHSLGRASRYYPARNAIIEGGKGISFRELHARVAALAAEIKGHGFEAGDRLALLLPNSRDYIELVYACAWLGVIAVPLNVRLSQAEIDRVLTDANPRGLIRHSSLPAPSVPLEWHRVIDEQPLEGRSDLYTDICYDPEAILALIYTSGTTGRPKGVVVTHANILANVDHFNYWMTYKEHGVYLHSAPIFHIADFPSIFAAPAFGACQITLPRFNPGDFCKAVERNEVTHSVLVPTMINLLTQSPEARQRDLTSLEVLAYGGSPMAPELILRTRELLPKVKLVQIYGLSETGFLTGLRDDEHVEGRFLSCGRPCPGIDVQVLDESGKQVDAGATGEFVARGANVMQGYWNDPEETARAFEDGLFRTGDVGYQDREGYFYILDRLKDMIVTGGENVYSGEVEAVLYEHPAVLEAAVFGIPDTGWGELVVACVVRKPGTMVTGDDLINHCRRHLANYKIPRRFEFAEAALPKSGSGKILKRILRERFWNHEARAVS